MPARTVGTRPNLRALNGEPKLNATAGVHSLVGKTADRDTPRLPVRLAEAADGSPQGQ